VLPSPRSSVLLDSDGLQFVVLCVDASWIHINPTPSSARFVRTSSHS
jgi:hypothetical protein